MLLKDRHECSSKSRKWCPWVPLLVLGWCQGWCPMHCFVVSISTLVPTTAYAPAKFQLVPLHTSAWGFFSGPHSTLCHLQSKLRMLGSGDPLGAALRWGLLGTRCVNTLCFALGSTHPTLCYRLSQHDEVPPAHHGNRFGGVLFWGSFLPCLISTLTY